MSNTITVQLSGLSGRVSLEVPEGASVADVREAADINEGLGIRSGGESLADDAPVYDEQVLVSTPPDAKHGIVG